MRLIKLKLLETWRTINVRNSDSFKLVMLDLERDCFNLEAKLFDRVCICVIHGLRILVDGDDLLMLAGIICIVIAGSILIEVLNR